MSEPELKSVPNPPKPELYPASGPFTVECADGVKIRFSDQTSPEQWEAMWAKELRWARNRLTQEYERQIDTLGLHEQANKVFDELAIRVDGLKTLEGEPYDCDSDPNWRQQIGPIVKYRALNGIDFWRNEYTETRAGGIVICASIEAGEMTVAVKHVLRNPTDSEKSQFDRKTAQRTSRDGVRTNKGLMTESVALYDRLLVKTEGYAGDPPGFHKRMAIRAMFEAGEVAVKN